jgi:hypothetical protein
VHRVDLPESLTLEEAFRAAYFLIDAYVGLDAAPSGDLELLRQYMLSDPARWSDWMQSVRRSLDDPKAAVEYLYDWRTQWGMPDQGGS